MLLREETQEEDPRIRAMIQNDFEKVTWFQDTHRELEFFLMLRDEDETTLMKNYDELVAELQYAGFRTKDLCMHDLYDYVAYMYENPLINDYFAIAIGAATREEIDKITEYTFKVNDVLKKFFDEAGIDLIDFKIEFGRYHGDIILADEISPDTCRLWDKETHEKLDKDRFRRDMGNVEDAYQEVFKRIGIK